MSTENPSPKEAIHDRLIFPLMAQIIELAKEHKISMVASFSLGPDPDNGENIYCTTAIVRPDEEKEPKARLTAAADMLRNGFTAFAVTTRRSS